MSSPDPDDAPGDAQAISVSFPDQEKPKIPLSLDVQIKDAGTCRKHVKVVIPRADVDRTFEDLLKDYVKDAFIPGFRPGKAPKALVERRFRKEVGDQVKSKLLMESLQQLDDQHQLNPISQPQLDLDAIALPEDGPMQFEMTVEVAPEFQLPDYQSLVVERPVASVREADIEEQVRALVERDARIVPKLDGAAERGDFVVAKLTFELDQPVVVEEAQFRLLDDLRTRDGTIADIGQALVGARPEQTRTATFRVDDSVTEEALRGKSIPVSIEVLDLKSFEHPDKHPEQLRNLGFESLGDLRDQAAAALQRQLDARQASAMRKQVVERLLERVQIDLPPDLVHRQERAMFARQLQDLRAQGIPERQLRALQIDLQANANQGALRYLREYFLLAKIAEHEKIEVGEADVERELESIAEANSESVRRVRAQLEKQGLIDTIGSQILERKALNAILEKVQVREVEAPAQEPMRGADLLDRDITGKAQVVELGDEEAPAPQA